MSIACLVLHGLTGTFVLGWERGGGEGDPFIRVESLVNVFFTWSEHAVFVILAYLGSQTGKAAGDGVSIGVT